MHKEERKALKGIKYLALPRVREGGRRNESKVHENEFFGPDAQNRPSQLPLLVRGEKVPVTADTE